MQEWVIFNAFILIMLSLDLFVFHRKPREIAMKEALGWSAFWITLAMLFNVYIYYARGCDDALNFFTGYLIEKALSVDNLFVFIFMFKYFNTPKSAMHSVLFWGVLGAIIFRAIFIFLGITLIAKFYWMTYLLGAFLVFTGIKMFKEKEADISNPLLKQIKQYFPVMGILIAIETADIIFALDSIPAILAITSDPYIVYTSNIFAILGLRSLFFVLSHLMSLFYFLHYGLAFILMFIGTKMMLSDIVHISTSLALSVVFVVMFISIFASKIKLS